MSFLGYRSFFIEIEFLMLRSNCLSSFLIHFSLVWFVGFHGISTFVGYLKPNQFLSK